MQEIFMGAKFRKTLYSL